MKLSFKSCLIALILGGCTVVVRGQKTPDEQQIIQFIDHETSEFLYKSKAQITQEYWVMDDKTLTNATAPDGICNQFDLAVTLTQTEVPPPSHARVVKSNYSFIIRGNMAFVTCDQVVTFPDNPAPLYSKELRVMEKINGQWKIHQLSVHHHP